MSPFLLTAVTTSLMMTSFFMPRYPRSVFRKNILQYPLLQTPDDVCLTPVLPLNDVSAASGAAAAHREILAAVDVADLIAGGGPTRWKSQSISRWPVSRH